MRVLFVASRFPWPLRRGDQLRAWHQLRELGRRHSIRLVTLSEEAPGDEAMATVTPLCESVRVVPLRPRVSMALLPFRWARGRPLQCGLFDSSALRRVVAEEMARGVDLVHLELARLDDLAQRIGTMPLFVDFVDALSLSTERRAQRSPMGVRAVLDAEARRVRRVEARLLRRAGGAAVVSAADARALGSPPNLHVIPLGVDPEAFVFDARPRHGATVMFTGNLGYFANVDAISWFARNVWPHVLSMVPGARFELVGARPHRSVKRIAATVPGVILRGPVLDMGAVLREASVAVAPLRAGAGQQIKVLEAMASGTPVVATRIVADGLGSASESLTIADDPEEFARQVGALLSDRSRAKAQAEAAVRQVREHHTWAGAAQLLEAAWESTRECLRTRSA